MTTQVDTSPISGFRGEYFFLSNFYPCRVVIDKINWQTAEHAYQASKTNDPHWKHRIQNASTAADARRLGRRAPVRPDWEDVKLPFMYAIVSTKFMRSDMVQMLLNTGHRKLIETNTWRDTFWGVCNGEGENHLGDILMKIRHQLRTGGPRNMK